MVVTSRKLSESTLLLGPFSHSNGVSPRMNKGKGWGRGMEEPFPLEQHIIMPRIILIHSMVPVSVIFLIDMTKYLAKCDLRREGILLVIVCRCRSP